MAKTVPNGLQGCCLGAAMQSIRIKPFALDETLGVN
jgi:hypothetical protein